jgi:hypothetical protein
MCVYTTIFLWDFTNFYPFWEIAIGLFYPNIKSSSPRRRQGVLYPDRSPQAEENFMGI